MTFKCQLCSDPYFPDPYFPPMYIGGLAPISGDPRVVDASGAKTVKA